MKPHNIEPEPVQVSDFTFSAISLGEFGRGRVLKNVACPESFDYLQPGTTKSGDPRLDKSESSAGWVARICTKTSYIRGANGNVSAAPEFQESIQVVARGQGAFGAGGRTWDDILLSTALEDFWLRVKPSRGPAYILLFCEGKVSELSFEEGAELLDIDFCGASPSSRGNLIRL